MRLARSQLTRQPCRSHYGSPRHRCLFSGEHCIRAALQQRHALRCVITTSSNPFSRWLSRLLATARRRGCAALGLCSRMALPCLPAHLAAPWSMLSPAPRRLGQHWRPRIPYDALGRWSGKQDGRRRTLVFGCWAALALCAWRDATAGMVDAAPAGSVARRPHDRLIFSMTHAACPALCLLACSR